MNAFHAYDIRGVYNRDFTADDVYRIGFFLPELFQTKQILVGRDVRVSSPEIFEALERGIHDAGADLHDAGLCTTPMVYFATGHLGYEASVMITASHNPKEYNGLKVSRKNALPVGLDTGLGQLREMTENRIIEPVSQRGTTKKVEVRPAYMQFLAQYRGDLSKLNIAIDCSNGMSALIAHEVFGDAPAYLYDTLDGTFPNHEPNPLIESNADALKAILAKHKSDIGLLFDGDADRVVFIDNRGRFVSPDLIIALMSRYFLPRNPGAKVLQDIRSSKAVGEYVAKYGGEIHTWRVGRAYAALKLREIDGLFGGELAGHYYFRDFYYSDSAMLASLIVLHIIEQAKAEGSDFATLIDEIRAYENSGEINFRIAQKAEAMEALRAHFLAQAEPTLFLDFDGYRIEYANWWFNVRPSNTEPYLRLLVEASDKQTLENRLAEIKEIIARFH